MVGKNNTEIKWFPTNEIKISRKQSGVNDNQLKTNFHFIRLI